MYNTKKIKHLHCREITSLPQIKKVIYCSCHLNNHQKSTACLSPHPFAYNQNLEHLTISQFCWLRFVFFFNHWVYSLLVPNFQKSPKFHLSKAFVKMLTSLRQQFLVLDSTISVRNVLHNDSPFSVLNTTKTLFQIMSLAAYTSKTNNMHNKSMTSTVISPFCITICKNFRQLFLSFLSP